MLVKKIFAKRVNFFEAVLRVFMLSNRLFGFAFLCCLAEYC